MGIIAVVYAQAEPGPCYLKRRCNMTTKVMFRKFKDGEVIAIFPNELYDWINKDLVWSYMHIGQHSACLLYTSPSPRDRS